MNNELKSLVIIFKAYNSLENSVKHSLVNTDLNVNQFTAMEALYVKGALTTQQLIDTILIPNSSMSYVLETLKNKKYLKLNKKAEDRRVQIISLTKKGEKLFEEIYARHFEYMRNIFGVLNSEEEVILQELLKKVGKRAEEVL